MASKIKRHGAKGELTCHICQAKLAFQGAGSPAEPPLPAGSGEASHGPRARAGSSLAAKFSLDTLLTRRVSSRGLLPDLTSRINTAADELLEAIDALCLAYGLSADGKGRAKD